MSPVDVHPGPLSGIRVLDLSRLLPGPYCTQILRDMGAEVIKIEDYDGGDYARYYPPLLEDNNAAAFHALNRGKKSILLNLKKQSDIQSLHALIGTADVIVESFRPGVMKKLGFDPDQLLKQHPKLVICSISGFGQTGPYALRAGHDMNYLARAGVLGMMKEPKVLPVQVADICAGSWPAAAQIIAGIYAAKQGGKGCYIDVSMTDAAYSLLIMPLAKYAANGVDVGAGTDILSGHYPCYDVYKCKDGYITVGNLEPKFWNSFVKALDVNDLKDEAYAEGEAGEKCRQRLQSVLMQKTGEEWAKELKDVDTCVEPVYAPEQRAQLDSHLKTRELDMEISVGGKKVNVVKTPLRMTGVQHAEAPGPKIGEHTKQILSQLKAKL